MINADDDCVRKALIDFDLILQSVLFSSAIGDGEFHPLEKQFIEQLCESADILKLLEVKTDLELDWDTVLRLSPDTIQQLSEKISELTDEYTNDFVEIFAKIDAEHEELNIYKTFVENIKNIFTPFVYIDGEISNDEINVGAIEIDKLLYDKWNNEKKIVQFANKKAIHDESAEKMMNEFYLKAPKIYQKEDLEKISNSLSGELKEIFLSKFEISTPDLIYTKFNEMIRNNGIPFCKSYFIDYDDEQNLYVVLIQMPTIVDLPNGMELLVNNNDKSLLENLVKTYLNYCAGISLFLAGSVFNLAINIEKILIRVTNKSEDDDEEDDDGMELLTVFTRESYGLLDLTSSDNASELVAPYMIDLNVEDVENDEESTEEDGNYSTSENPFQEYINEHDYDQNGTTMNPFFGTLSNYKDLVLNTIQDYIQGLEAYKEHYPEKNSEITSLIQKINSAFRSGIGKASFSRNINRSAPMSQQVIQLFGELEDSDRRILLKSLDAQIRNIENYIENHGWNNIPPYFHFYYEIDALKRIYEILIDKYPL